MRPTPQTMTAAMTDEFLAAMECDAAAADADADGAVDDDGDDDDVDLLIDDGWDEHAQ